MGRHLTGLDAEIAAAMPPTAGGIPDSIIDADTLTIIDPATMGPPATILQAGRIWVEDDTCHVTDWRVGPTDWPTWCRTTDGEYRWWGWTGEQLAAVALQAGA